MPKGKGKRGFKDTGEGPSVPPPEPGRAASIVPQMPPQLASAVAGGGANSVGASAAQPDPKPGIPWFYLAAVVLIAALVWWWKGWIWGLAALLVLGFLVWRLLRPKKE